MNLTDDQIWSMMLLFFAALVANSWVMHSLLRRHIQSKLPRPEPVIVCLISNFSVAVILMVKTLEMIF